MSKILWLLIIAGVLLTAGGVIEVKVHPDRLGDVPGRVIATVSDKSLLEKARALAISLKRSGEQWLIKDERQKLELAIDYINDDAARLQEVAAKNEDDGDRILPQAKLLMASIERAAKLTETAPVDDIAALRDDTKAAFNRANEALVTLKNIQQRYIDLQQSFASITSTLEKHIGALGIETPESSESGVAGARDEAATTSPAPSASRIPLSF